MGFFSPLVAEMIILYVIYHKNPKIYFKDFKYPPVISVFFKPGTFRRGKLFFHGGLFFAFFFLIGKKAK